MHATLVASALLLLPFVAACGDSEGGGGVTADDLDGNTYESTDVTGHDLVPDTVISLVFEDGKLSVNAGCNTMAADFEVDGDDLQWSGPAAATMMACSEELEAQDLWLTELLTDGMTAELDGSTLTLTDDEVEIVLEAK